MQASYPFTCPSQYQYFLKQNYWHFALHYESDPSYPVKGGTKVGRKRKYIDVYNHLIKKPNRIPYKT
jgi:hypothetical protein